MSRRRSPIDVNPMNSIGSIIGLVLFFVAMFYLLKGLFWILGLIAPIMLIGALIVDRRVVTDYVKMLFNLLKRNPIMGIVGVLLTFVAAPVVAVFLFGKAMLNRKLGKFSEEIKQKREGQYTEYEEVETDPFPNEELKLPEIEKPIIIQKPRQERPSQDKPKNTRNEYEDLFGE